MKKYDLKTTQPEPGAIVIMRLPGGQEHDAPTTGAVLLRYVALYGPGEMGWRYATADECERYAESCAACATA